MAWDCTTGNGQASIGLSLMQPYLINTLAAKANTIMIKTK